MRRPAAEPPAPSIEMNTCELGAVHLSELAYQDWAALAAWADLREMEKRRIINGAGRA